jgi:hypothetical protein
MPVDLLTGIVLLFIPLMAVLVLLDIVLIYLHKLRIPIFGINRIDYEEDV